LRRTAPARRNIEKVSLFVTGTDTGVGKTHTIIQLLRLLRRSGVSCAGFKPICCGDRNDAEQIVRASNASLTIDDINPIWLKAPLAPLPAARIENVSVEIDQIFGAFSSLRARVEVVIVEGVGGWLVPIRTDYFVSDLAAEMSLPVLVVAMNRLGCLNHTFLTVKSVQERGLCCVGVSLNEIPGANDLAICSNADVLREFLDVPVLPACSVQASELSPIWQQTLGVTSQT
jgi:dethiobiotin synthetase